MAETMFKVRYRAFDGPGTLEQALVNHHAILAQVRLGDPQGARSAMLQDLTGAEAIQRRAVGG